jgi:hypothetical protein
MTRRAVSHTRQVTVGISRTKTWDGPFSWTCDTSELCKLEAARDAARQATYFADYDLACCLEIAIISVKAAFKGSGELRFASRLQQVLDDLRALRSEIGSD